MEMIIMSKADQQAIAKYFSKKPVLYIGGLGQLFGLQAGLLLGQLLFWHGKGKRKDGFIFKTAEEFRAELGMSRANQETAIRTLVGLGVLEYKLAQVPATRHFKLNLAKLHELLPRLKETNNLHYPNPSSYYVENDETITKITRENTTKSTTVTNKKDFFEKKQELADKLGRPP